MPLSSFAADWFDLSSRESRFSVEAGAIRTENIEIRGFNQRNATENWSGSGPTYRLEYWLGKSQSWNFGLVFQPLSFSYSGVIQNTLTAKGQTFTAGSSAKLYYAFPSLRFTANYPIYGNDGGDYVRVGGSVITRYAHVKLTSGSIGINDTNLIFFPVLNVEMNKVLTPEWSLFTRADFLPSIDGNVFLDGFFDTFVGVKRHLKSGSSIDLGVRSIFGGYDPKKQDEYANRIFYNSLVVRYSW